MDRNNHHEERLNSNNAIGVDLGGREHGCKSEKGAQDKGQLSSRLLYVRTRVLGTKEVKTTTGRHSSWSGISVESAGEQQSIRKCKGRLGIHVFIQTVFAFPDVPGTCTSVFIS